MGIFNYLGDLIERKIQESEEREAREREEKRRNYNFDLTCQFLNDVKNYIIETDRDKQNQ